jgi:hypothetical protein
MGSRPERPTAEAEACDTSPTDDADAADFRVPENATAKAIVDLVTARIRRSSSGVYAVVQPATKRHRKV